MVAGGAGGHGIVAGFGQGEGHVVEAGRLGGRVAVGGRLGGQRIDAGDFVAGLIRNRSAAGCLGQAEGAGGIGTRLRQAAGMDVRIVQEWRRSRDCRSASSCQIIRSFLGTLRYV